MNGINYLLLSAKSPIMLYKNILINSINNCYYRNPIIGIMRNDVPRNFIAYFGYFMFSSFPHQKPSLGKLCTYRFNIRKTNKTITHLIFNKLTAVVLEGRNYGCPFGAWKRLRYKSSLLIFDEHVPQHQEWLDSFHKKILEM